MNPYITRMLVDDISRQVRADVRSTALAQVPSPSRSRIAPLLARIVQALHATHATWAAGRTRGAAHPG
jgi:molybdopterin-guanine dinucleotide biosynthesis protein A